MSVCPSHGYALNTAGKCPECWHREANAPSTINAKGWQNGSGFPEMTEGLFTGSAGLPGYGGLPKPPDLASRLRQYEYGSGAAPSFGAYLYHSPNIATAMPEDFDLEATLEKLRQVREAGEQENLKAVQHETLSCGQCKETLDDRDVSEGKHRCWRCGWREK